MDQRIAIAASSLIGATLGVAAMSFGAPSTTGPELAPAAVVATTPLSAPSVAGSPSAPTAPATPANPFGNTPDGDPFGAPPADNPFGAPADNPFAQLADPREGELDDFKSDFSSPPPVDGKGFNEAQGVDRTVAGSVSDFPGDVRGVGRLFRDRDEQIKDCMDKAAPPAEPGERRIMIRVQLDPRPEDKAKAGITGITAPKDTEGRYTEFLGCLTTSLADAEFGLPGGNGSAGVNWSLRR